jgi:hypothetical protein
MTFLPYVLQGSDYMKPTAYDIFLLEAWMDMKSYVILESSNSFTPQMKASIHDLEKLLTSLRRKSYITSCQRYVSHITLVPKQQPTEDE